jgi:hypothetical protein
MLPDKAKHPVQDREKSPFWLRETILQSMADRVKVRPPNYKSAPRSVLD